MKRLKNKFHSENIYRIFIYEKIIIMEVWRKSIQLKRIKLKIDLRMKIHRKVRKIYYKKKKKFIF